MTIQGDIIRADKDRLLFYVPENKVWGPTARIAMYKGETLKPEDFKEVIRKNYEKVDGAWYDLFDMSYAQIKSFIVKLRYTNDDQIALMLNWQEDPEKYGEKYNAMQEWREYASEVARKYTNSDAKKIKVLN